MSISRPRANGKPKRGSMSAAPPPTQSTNVLPPPSWSAFFFMGLALPLHLVLGLFFTPLLAYFVLWKLVFIHSRSADATSAATLDGSWSSPKFFAEVSILDGVAEHFLNVKTVILLVYLALYLYPAERQYPGWRGLRRWFWNLLDTARSGRDYCGRFEVRSLLEDRAALARAVEDGSCENTVFRSELVKPGRGTLEGCGGAEKASGEDHDGGEDTTQQASELARTRAMLAAHGLRGLSDDKIREIIAQGNAYDEQGHFDNNIILGHQSEEAWEKEQRGQDFMVDTVRKAVGLDAVSPTSPQRGNTTEEDASIAPDDSGFDPAAQYVIPLHPHGTIINARMLWVTKNEQLTSPFLKRDWRMVAANILFRIPLVREISLSFGAIASDRTACEVVLKAGCNLCVYPGGLDEANEVEDKLNKIKLKARKGFIRLAVKHGISILPTFVFGELEQVPYAP